MTKTYDFIFYAKKDLQFKKSLVDLIENGVSAELFTDIHRLKFDGKNKNVFVEALSENSPFANKVIPTTIPYKDLLGMINI